MFREEQPLLYIYKVVKETKNHPLKGELFNSKKADLSDGVIQVGKYRHAFVGDMQEWFDKSHKTNNMRNFAVSNGGEHKVYNYIKDVVYVRETIIAYIIRKGKDTLTKFKNKWRYSNLSFRFWARTTFKKPKEQPFIFEEIFGNNK